MGYAITALVSAILGFGLALLIRGAHVKENLQQVFDDGYHAGRNSK